MKKYIVKLVQEERSDLLALTSKGRSGARRIKHALILLAADEGAIDDEIVARLRVGARTVERVRKRFVEESLEAALSDRPRPGRAQRYDYEYERKGTANIFMAVEPLRGWRGVTVTERRTKLDFAAQIQQLVDVHYPEAKKVRLVLDNLNTHKPASLYEAFPPAEARRILR